MTGPKLKSKLIGSFDQYRNQVRKEGRIVRRHSTYPQSNAFTRTVGSMKMGGRKFEVRLQFKVFGESEWA